MKNLFSTISKRASLLFLISISASHAHTPHSLVQPFGNFSHMLKTGDTSQHKPLYSLQGKKGLYALGALEGLKGEVIIIDGMVLISPATFNDGHVVPVTVGDHATILALANVQKWVSIPIPNNLSRASFEAFVLEQSAQQGLGEVPFPFMLQGQTKNLEWHVVNGLIPVAQRKDVHAFKIKFNESTAEGILLGFHVGKEFEGIISHVGKRFHIHYVDEGFQHAGHVDNFEIGENAILFLPQI